MRSDPAAACPHCGAARVAGPECPRCGVIYAKARPPRAPAPALLAPDGPLDAAAAPAAPGLATPAAWSGELDDARAELLARQLVPPIALGVAWLLVSSNMGHALVRTFLSMWVHELGHAVTAWLCGFGAFPGPWRTPVSAGRMPVVIVLVAAGLGWLVHRGRVTRRRVLLLGGVAGLVLQAACLALPSRAAQALITFGGDGGSLALGALLVATFYAGPESRLRQGALRWGFVGIGAASLVDALDTWVRARIGRGEIPLGEIEGIGLSDASKLTSQYGWTYAELTGRYVALGVVCLAAIAAIYVVGVVRARARVTTLTGRAG